MKYFKLKILYVTKNIKFHIMLLDMNISFDFTHIVEYF